MTIRSVIISYSMASAIAVGGRIAGALTPKGALASTVVGGSVIDGFGGRGAVLLGLFFGSGSGLSRLPASGRVAVDKAARNERQVVANGGVAALAGLGSGWIDQETAVAILAGSLAAATSDTWATEIGLRIGQVPRYVISGARVSPGLSGGITPAGTLASAAGAATLAVLAGALYRRRWLIPAVVAGGMCGSILDSAVGELLQAKCRNPSSGELMDVKPDEVRALDYESGWRWVDNDVVNLACTVTGGIIAALLWQVVRDA